MKATQKGLRSPGWPEQQLEAPGQLQLLGALGERRKPGVLPWSRDGSREVSPWLPQFRQHISRQLQARGARRGGEPGSCLLYGPSARASLLLPQTPVKPILSARGQGWFCVAHYTTAKSRALSLFEGHRKGKPLEYLLDVGPVVMRHFGSRQHSLLLNLKSPVSLYRVLNTWQSTSPPTYFMQALQQPWGQVFPFFRCRN